MLASSTLYEKHDSFVGVRHRSFPGDVGDRVRELVHRIERSKLRLSAEKLEVVRQACEELLGKRDVAPYQSFSLQSYVVEEINRLPDELLPRYLWYRYRYEAWPERKVLDQFPPCLQIEPTSVCNYRCVFCYQTDRHFTAGANSQMGMMPLELFQSLIDQAQGLCEAVTLASRGEPSLCPDLKAMLAYAAGKFLAFKINTNASHLDEALSHAILQADVNTVVFSIDAASEPAYSQLRVGGKLAQVVEHVERFRRIQLAHYPKARTITRVSGVQVPGAADLEAMTRRWGDLVDQVAFVKYNPWENTYERPVNDIEQPCSDLWRRMFVWWDGRVNPCDVDYRSTLAVGDARTERLADLWQGERYARLRTAHVARARRDCSPCNRCTVV